MVNDGVTILKIAIPLPLNHLFDYLIPADLINKSIQPGTRVIVPFKKSKKVGFVVASSTSSTLNNADLKYILLLLDEQPLISNKDFQLLQWASDYYHYPLGEVFSAVFPLSLRTGKKAILATEKYYQLSERGKLISPKQLHRSPKQKKLFELLQSQNTGISSSSLKKLDKNWLPAIKALLDKDFITIKLQAKATTKITSKTESQLTTNAQQSKAISQLSANLGSFSVSLLEGVTGSGKTEIYMHVIQNVLDLGMQIMVLLPEITLTPQLESRFRVRFSVSIVIYHSKLTETQRHNAWVQIQQGQSQILLGTRSALFTPFKKLGLIILDEEHDSSFKQQDGFRFSARDLAIVRAKLLNIPVILGSATPSLESLYNVQKKRYQIIYLSQRAGNSIAPKFWLLDIRNKKLLDGISQLLLEQIKITLQKKEQVLLFLNRRGFAPVLICYTCNWIARCNNCDTSLVVHYQKKLLHCHSCQYQRPLLNQCPRCKDAQLKPIGLGTQRVEAKLLELFPQQKIIRLDRDSIQHKDVFESYIKQINLKQVNIILGTQMLAKGHHFPNVTLVAILDVDSGLFSIDFHAAEKLAQLIVQVAGRAGRAEKPGKVILQTRQPNHPLLTMLLSQGYSKFAQKMLEDRQQATLPPFSFQALLRVSATNPEDPQIFLKTICELIKTIQSIDTLALGPVPAPRLKRSGNYHFQLLLQNPKRKQLQKFLKVLVGKIYLLKTNKKVRWSLDVDPIDLY